MGCQPLAQRQAPSTVTALKIDLRSKPDRAVTPVLVFTGLFLKLLHLGLQLGFFDIGGGVTVALMEPAAALMEPSYSIGQGLQVPGIPIGTAGSETQRSKLIYWFVQQVKFSSRFFILVYNGFKLVDGRVKVWVRSRVQSRVRG